MKNQVVQALEKIKANHDEGIFTDAGRLAIISWILTATG